MAQPHSLPGTPFTPRTLAWTVLPFCVDQAPHTPDAHDLTVYTLSPKTHTNWRLLLYRLACLLLASGYFPSHTARRPSPVLGIRSWNRPARPWSIASMGGRSLTYSTTQRLRHTSIAACMAELRQVVDSEIVPCFKALRSSDSGPRIENVVMQAVYRQLLSRVDPASQAFASYSLQFSHYSASLATQPPEPFLSELAREEKGALSESAHLWSLDFAPAPGFAKSNGEGCAVITNAATTGVEQTTPTTTMTPEYLAATATATTTTTIAEASMSQDARVELVRQLIEVWQLVIDHWSDVSSERHPFSVMQKYSASVMNGFPDINEMLVSADDYAWEATTAESNDRRNALAYAGALFRPWLGLSPAAPTLPPLLHDVFVSVTVARDLPKPPTGAGNFAQQHRQQHQQQEEEKQRAPHRHEVTVVPIWLPACVAEMLNKIDTLKHQQRFFLVTFLAIATTRMFTRDRWSSLQIEDVLEALSTRQLFNPTGWRRLEQSDTKNKLGEMRSSFAGEISRHYHARDDSLESKDKFLRGCRRMTDSARVAAYNERAKLSLGELEPYCPFAKQKFIEQGTQNSNRNGSAPTRDIEDIGGVVLAASKHACAGESRINAREFHNAWVAFSVAHNGGQ